MPCDGRDEMQCWNLGRPVLIARGSVPAGATGPIALGDTSQTRCLRTHTGRRRNSSAIATGACGGGPVRSSAIGDADTFELPQSGVGPIRLAADPEKCFVLPQHASHVDVKLRLVDCGQGTPVSRQFVVPTAAWVSLEPLSAKGAIRWAAHPDRCLAAETGTRGTGKVRVQDCVADPCGGDNMTTPSSWSQCFTVPGSLPRVGEPVDCQWGSWSEWSACSAACGAKGGSRWRTRGAARPAANGGLPCFGWRATAWRESSPCFASSSVGGAWCDAAGEGIGQVAA